MKTVIPYNDRITEKNLADFADMLKDAAAARSYASVRSWTIGTDGTHEWAIAAGWPDRNSLEVKIAKTVSPIHNYMTSFAGTGLPSESHKEYIDKDSPKSVIIQQVRYFIDRFLEACGELPIADTVPYEETEELEQKSA